MQVTITGGAGFLGRRLAEELLRRGTLAGPDGGQHRIERLTLVDVSAAPPLADERVTQVTGDVADPQLIARVIGPETTSVFHLAAIVSGMAEAEFELGLRINLDASRLLLDRCRT